MGWALVLGSLSDVFSALRAQHPETPFHTETLNLQEDQQESEIPQTKHLRGSVFLVLPCVLVLVPLRLLSESASSARYRMV